MYYNTIIDLTPATKHLGTTLTTPIVGPPDKLSNPKSDPDTTRPPSSFFHPGSGSRIYRLVTKRMTATTTMTTPKKQAKAMAQYRAQRSSAYHSNENQRRRPAISTGDRPSC